MQLMPLVRNVVHPIDRLRLLYRTRQREQRPPRTRTENLGKE